MKPTQTDTQTEANTNQQTVANPQNQAHRLIAGATRPIPITYTERLTAVQPLGRDVKIPV